MEQWPIGRLECYNLSGSLAFSDWLPGLVWQTDCLFGLLWLADCLFDLLWLTDCLFDLLWLGGCLFSLLWLADCLFGLLWLGGCLFGLLLLSDCLFGLLWLAACLTSPSECLPFGPAFCDRQSVYLAYSNPWLEYCLTPYMSSLGGWQSAWPSLIGWLYVWLTLIGRLPLCLASFDWLTVCLAFFLIGCLEGWHLLIVWQSVWLLSDWLTVFGLFWLADSLSGFFLIGWLSVWPLLIGWQSVWLQKSPKRLNYRNIYWTLYNYIKQLWIWLSAIEEG